VVVVRRRRRRRGSGGGCAGGGDDDGLLHSNDSRVTFLLNRQGIRGKTFTRRRFWFSRTLQRERHTSDRKIITF